MFGTTMKDRKYLEVSIHIPKLDLISTLAMSWEVNLKVKLELQSLLTYTCTCVVQLSTDRLIPQT